MKVAISTDNGYVSAHFGRCSSYTIYEIEGEKILRKEQVPNPGHEPGFLPNFLSEKGVSCIIAGGMGRRAQGLFAEKNIEAVVGVQGSVDEVIEKFIKQELEAGDDLCGHKHGVEEHSLDHPHHHDQADHQISLPPASKICITAQGQDLNAEVDPNFGRARYFLVFDARTENYEVIENSMAEASQGAGIQAAQLISDRNVDTVITGSLGPHAQKVLYSSGIRVITGAKGKVKDILEKYKPKVS